MDVNEFLIRIVVRARNEISGALDKAAHDVDKLTAAERRAETQMGRTQKSSRNLRQEFEDFDKSVRNGEKSVDDAIFGYRRLGQEMDKLARKQPIGSKMSEDLNRGSLAARRATAEFEQMSKSQAQAARKSEDDKRRAMEATEAARRKITSDTIRDEGRARVEEIKHAGAQRALRSDVERTTHAFEAFDLGVTRGQHNSARARAGYQQFGQEFSNLSRKFEAGSEDALHLAERVEYTRSRLANLKDETRGVGTEFQRARTFMERFLRIDPSNLERFNGHLERLSSNLNKGRLNVAAFDNRLRGLLVLGVFAFFGQLVGITGALAGELISLASAAAQAGAALGGALAAGAAQAIPVIGLLAAAWGRVGAVFKAVQQSQLASLKAGHDNTAQMDKQRTAADGVRSAQEGVRSAVEGVRNAQNALADAHRRVADSESELAKSERSVGEARKQARRDIEDLIAAEKDAMVQYERAKLQLEESQRTKAQDIATGNVDDQLGDILDVRDAQLGVDAAHMARQRAIQDANLARRRGVNRDPGVLSAQESVAQNRRSLTDAQHGVASAAHDLDEANRKVGVARKQVNEARANMQRAANDTSATADQLQALLDKLDPAERRLYDHLQSLLTTYKKVMRPITDIIINSFTYAVDRAEKTLHSPKLIGAFTDLARNISRQMRRITDALTSNRSINFIAEMAKEAERNLGPLTTIGIHLLHIFESVAKAGAPALHLFILFLRDLSAQSDKATGSSSGISKLRKFFLDGESMAEDIIHLTSAVLHLFGALVGASAKQGQDSIESMTKRINNATTWIHENTKKVQQFFKDAGHAAGLVADTLWQIVKALGSLYDPDSLQALHDAIDKTILPTLVMVARTLAVITTEIAKFFGTPVGSVIGQFALATVLLNKAFKPFAQLAGGAFIKIGEIAAAFGRVAAAEKLAAAGARILEIATGPVGLAFAGLAAAVLLLDHRFHFLHPLLEKIKDVFGDVKDAIDSLPGPAKIAAGLAIGAVVFAAWRRLIGLIRIARTEASTPIAAPGPVPVGGGRGGRPGVPGEPAVPPVLLGPRGEPLTPSGRVPRAGTRLGRLRSGLGRVGGRVRGFLGGGGGAGAAGLGALLIGSQIGGDDGSVLSGAGTGATIGSLGGPVGALVGASIGATISGIQANKNQISPDDAPKLIKSLELLKGLHDRVKGLAAEGNVKGLRRVANQIRDIGTIGGIDPKKLDQLAAGVDKVAKQNIPFDHARKQIHDFVVDGVNNIDNLRDRFETNMRRIASTVGLNTKRGRDLAKDNIDEMVDHMGNSLRRGVVKIDQYTGEITDIVKHGSKAQKDELSTQYDDELVDIQNAWKNKKITTTQANQAIRQINRDQLRLQRGEISDRYSKMQQDLKEKLHDGKITTTQYKQDVTKLNRRMARDVSQAHGGMAKNIRDVWNSVLDGAGSSIQDLAKQVNAGLKDLGGKPVKVVIPQYKGHGNFKLPESAVTGGGPQGDGSAQGGFPGMGKGVGEWVGRMGERGKDLVHAVLGRGEAVLNSAHQRVVNMALGSTFGTNLDGMFKSMRGFHRGGRGVGFASGGRPNRRKGRPLDRYGQFANLGGKPGNVIPGIYDLIGLMQSKFPALTVGSTTDHSYLTTSGNVSDHNPDASGLGHAVDLSKPGDYPYMFKAADWIKRSGLYKHLKQGIHNPNLAVNDGQLETPPGIFAGQTWTEHLSHIHLALYGALTGAINAAVQGRMGAAGAGAAAVVAPHIKLPKVLGDSPQAEMVRLGVKKVRDAAQRFINKKAAETGGGSASGGGPSFSGFKGPWVAVERQIAKARKWNIGDWDKIIQAESSGVPSLKNPRSTAFGLGQLLDFNYNQYGGGPGSSPVEQIKAMARYIIARYGNPTRAWAVHQTGTYAGGGFAGLEGLKSFAGGGDILSGGGAGKPVPIIAHIGEWVLNKKQQIAMARKLGISVAQLKRFLQLPSGGEPAGKQTIQSALSGKPFADTHSLIHSARDFVGDSLDSLIHPNWPASLTRSKSKGKGHRASAASSQDSILGRSIPKNLLKYNKRWGWDSTDSIGSKAVAAIANWAGFPAGSAVNISHGESAWEPGAIGYDQNSIHSVGYGLMQNTTKVNGSVFDNFVQRLGGWKEMLNPLKNMIAARFLAHGAHGLGPWKGTNYGNAVSGEWGPAILGSGGFAGLRSFAGGGVVGAHERESSMDSLASSYSASNAQAQSAMGLVHGFGMFNGLLGAIAGYVGQLGKVMRSGAIGSKKFTFRLIHGFQNLIGDGGMLDQLSAAIDQFTTDLATRTAALTYKVTKTGKVLQQLDPTAQAQRSLDDLGKTYNALVGERGAINKGIRRVTAEMHRLRKGGISDAEQGTYKRLQGYRQNLLGRRSTVDQGITQNISDRYDAAGNVVQSILDTVGDKAQRSQGRIANRQSLAQMAGPLFASTLGLGAGHLAHLQVNSLKNQESGLQIAMARAKQLGRKDLAKDIASQIDDIQTQILQAVHDGLQGQLDQVTARQERVSANADRINRIADVIAGTAGAAGQPMAFNLRGQALAATRAGLVSERSSLQGLIQSAAKQGDLGMVDTLNQQLADLNVSLAENSQAIAANTAAARAAAIQSITDRSSFLTGTYGGLGGILSSLGTLTGQTDRPRQASLLQRIGTTLGQTGSGLADQLLSQFGIDVRGQQGTRLVDTLSSLNYDGIEANMSPDDKARFESLINSIISNSTAIVDNTEQLREVNQTSALQSFATTAWTLFRRAIFTGSGEILPQFMPTTLPSVASTTSAIMPSALSLSGRALVAAGRGGPTEDHTHLYVTNPTQVLDVDHVFTEAAFKKEQQKAS